MISRRAFVVGGGSVLVAPITAAAQPAAKRWRIGVLRFDSANSEVAAGAVDDLREGLRELGYVDGNDITFEIRWGEGKLERLPHLAAELVRLRVDVIVTSGPPAIRAVKEATSTIPIVMGRMDDVDAHGIVTNLAHPGGNITGLSFQTGELSGKWLQLLKELLPQLSRVAALWDESGTANQVRTVQLAARSLAVHLQVLEVRAREDFERAFAVARRGNVEALVILASPLLTVNASRLAELAARSRLPAIYYNQRFAIAGGLLAYGPTPSEISWRRAAMFVDRILRGGNPAEIPIEQPTKFDLIINLKTAKALGLTVPPSVLLRADRLIE